MSRPLRSGRAPRPGPDSDGQDATLTSPSPIRPGPVPGPDSGGPGPALALPVTPHGPAPRGTAGPTLPASQGQLSQRQLWTCYGSTQQVQARSTGVPHRPVGSDRNRANVALDEPLVRSTTPRLDKPLELREGKPPTRQTQRRWGGSTPNHPAALQSGMQMGSESPEQHEYLSTRSVMLRSKTITRHARRWKLG